VYVTAHDDVVSVLHAFIVVSANSVKLLYTVFFVLGVTHEKFIDVATGIGSRSVVTDNAVVCFDSHVDVNKLNASHSVTA
jgi:hypothetical protein